MPAGTYENDVPPLRGDVFLDRILGWLCLVCGLPILGVAINRLLHPPKLNAVPVWVEQSRIGLIVLGLVALGCIISSRPAALKAAAALFAIRLVGALALYPWSGGPRFAGSEILFDLVAIGYCLLRIKQAGRD